MSGVTYGTLVGLAREQIHAGARQTSDHPFASPDRARAALVAYRELLAALRAHTWAVIGPEGPNIRSGGPAEHAVIAIARALPDVSRRPQPPSKHLRPVHPWGHAAIAIRAASDLLAVHHTPKGLPRSPDAENWTDPVSRDMALVQLAGITAAALQIEDTLALRAVQAHLPWTEISWSFPGLAGARAQAAAIATAATDTRLDDRGGLGSVGLIGEPIRTDTPTHELTDRLTRLRHLAWELANNPDYSTTTLRDLAAVAIAVNAHTAAYHATPGAELPASAVALVARARAWQVVAKDLSDYLRPTPPHAEIRAQASAVIALLRRIAPLDGDATAPATRRRPEPVTAGLRAAVHATEQAGQWAARSFDLLAGTGQLKVRIESLSGDHTTDDPELTAAKLSRTGAVIAPVSRLEQTRRAFARAHEVAPAEATRSASGLGSVVETGLAMEAVSAARYARR